MFQHLARCALLSLLVFSQPSLSFATDDRGLVSELLSYYSRSSKFAFDVLTTGEIDLLLNGEPVVRVSGKPDAAHDDAISSVGVHAFQILSSPRLLVWLSIMGGNDERDYRLTRAMLSRGVNGSYVRYQHVDLPWPLRDRHWVIQCHKNLALAANSNDAVWEHHWSLHEQGPELLQTAYDDGKIEGLDADALRKSVYLPANSGAWALLDLGGYRTLVVAYVDADLGGYFPDSLVRTFTKSRLKAGLETLEELSKNVDRSYNGDPAIHDGHGRQIPPREATDVARDWRNEVRIATVDQNRMQR